MEQVLNTIYNIIFPITDLKIYLFICFIILLMFISVMTSITRIFRTYKKYLKVPNKAGLTGGQIAAASKKVLDIPNLEFALVKGTLTDAYSSKHKTLLMSKDVYESSSLASMAIIAHEFGHAVQHIITDKAQPVSTASLPWFLIEVPSLTSETVMFKYLYDNAKTNEDKLSYLQNFINTFMGNVYSGCRLAKYEHYVRENIRTGKILDVETASNEYLQVLNKFSGLDYDERIKYNWMSDGHIFVAYYNYVYSLSMIVATAFAKGIYEGNKETLDNFYKFMETGYSKYGLDNLKECGIDLMDDKVYNDAFSFFEEVVEDFCTLCEEKQKEKGNDKEK